MSADWKWFGHAGHLIVGQWCRFHLCTLVGKYLVSTVGEYVPDEGVREITARCRGITLEGHGDARLADYMKKIGFEEIGAGRKYETMVFLAGQPCEAKDCHCGLPEISGDELAWRGYNDAGSTAKGHLELCKEYSAKE